MWCDLDIQMSKLDTRGGSTLRIIWAAMYAGGCIIWATMYVGGCSMF